MNDKNVPYIVYESSEARHERIEKRLIIALVVSLILMFATNGLWLYHESLYDYDTITVDSDDGNANYVGRDGGIYNGENSSEKKTQEKQEGETTKSKKKNYR